MTGTSSSESDAEQKARLSQVAVSWDASGFSTAQVHIRSGLCLHRRAAACALSKGCIGSSAPCKTQACK